jgi:hypothetical protein
MKISKTHEQFAYLLNIRRESVLNCPKNYLGPNWEAVINFWLYLDTLTHEQLLVVRDWHLALGDEGRYIAGNKVLYATNPRIKYAYPANVAAYCSVSCAKLAAYYATQELIGLEKLLEKRQQPVFFPMFLNP